MADPEIDHGFVYNSQGLMDILHSPFFDLNLDVDESVEGYVNRIIFTLAQSIEEHIPSGQWQIVGHSPTPSPPIKFSLTKALCILAFSVASLGLLKVLSQ